jgi:hypothetical protein
MKVRLKLGWVKAYPELTFGNVYRVLEVRGGYLRLISDAGEPILFILRAFEFVDPAQSADWVSAPDEDGDVYGGPPKLTTPRYFFELWHDGDREVQTRLRNYVYDVARAERATMPDPPNRYIRCRWMSENREGLRMTFSELDGERWEVRRVEVFLDGRVSCADVHGSYGTTELAKNPIGEPEATVDNQEYEIAELTRAEFEAVFDAALQGLPEEDHGQEDQVEDQVVKT